MDDQIASPQPRTRRVPRSVTAIAVAVGLTLGAAGIAVAASPDERTTTVVVGAKDGDRIGHRLGHRGEKDGRERGPGGPGGLGRALHGEAVVEDGIGGYRTVVFQRGAVTAVSSTALTVKSADGFTREYVLTSQTRVNRGRAAVGDIKTGHQVAVRAVLVNGKATAQGIRDQALRPAKKTG